MKEDFKMYEAEYKGQVQKRCSGVEINSKSIDSIYGISNKKWIKVTGSISYINIKHEDHEHITNFAVKPLLSGMGI